MIIGKVVNSFLALPAAGLFAHTAQALGSGPVSAAIPNANFGALRLTHPDYASLADALSAVRKEGENIPFFNPLYRLR